MSPRTKAQFEKIRTDSRNNILDAALHVFAEEGYHAASISKIAKQAKISKGLLYNYFDSKEDLLRTLLVSFFEKNLRLMNFSADKELTDEIMIDYVNNLFVVIDEHRNLWKLYFSLVTQPIIAELAKQELMPKLIPFQSAMINYFTAKFPNDSIGMMRYFHTVMDGAKMQYLYDPENYPLDQIKGYIIKQFIETKQKKN